MSPIAVVLVVLTFVVVLFLARQTRVLLVIEVSGGRIVRMSGRGPAELCSDLEDVLARSMSTGKVVLFLEGGRATVRATGSMDEGTKQMLRNVVGRFPIARLRSARRVERRS